MRWYWVLTGLLLLVGCRTGERTIARVDGLKVTEQELNEALHQRYATTMLGELIKRKLLEREAKQQNIFISDLEFQNALRQHRLPDTPEIRQQIYTELLLDKLAQAMAKVSEAEAKHYFEQHREQFEKPERVRLRDIVRESKEDAQEIWKALQLRKGTNFADLARHFSINPATSHRGGDMGVVPIKDLHPNLQTVVRNLKVGEFSKPIEIKGEWVIIKLEERLPAEKKDFDEVREQVMARLKKQKMWQLRLELPSKLLRKAKVEVYDPSLQEAIQKITKGGN